MDGTLQRAISWPLATLKLPTIFKQPEWKVDINIPTIREAKISIIYLNRRRTVGSNRLTSEVLKDDSPALVIRMTDILAKVCDLDIPSD